MNEFKSEARDGITWITVSPMDWIEIHGQLRDEGFTTLEYLTAVHNSGDEFIVVSHLSGDGERIVRTVITDVRIDSLSQMFVIAEFHERETHQMFGITFEGLNNDAPAFAGVAQRALRKDFALNDRLAVSWPGAVELDVNARRRPSLPPGVFAEWTQ